MSVIATIAVIALLVFEAGVVYDRVMRLRRQVQHTWRQLEQQRHARQDIVTRIATVCSSGPADARAVQAVETARQNAAAATSPADAARKEHVLGDAVGALLTSSAIAMSAEVAEQAKRLGEVELAYRQARQVYNTAAQKYNRVISGVPGKFIASPLSLRPAELFEPRPASP
jgi:LemA protein